MHNHHPGDGCAGESRPLAPEELHDIGMKMGDMLMGIARGKYADALTAGAWIGVHYGDIGEWHLAIRLATQIAGLSPASHCNALGQPVIAKAIRLDQDPVLAVAHHCASQFKETRDHTTEEVSDALRDVLPHVEALVHYFKAQQKEDCRAAWERIYEMTEVDGDHSRAVMLRAAAGSSLLLCWATHVSTMKV